jgi:predicted Zn-dependent protease
LFLAFACTSKNTTPSKDSINSIGLKRGNLISCGPGENQFGEVSFAVSGSNGIKEDFNLAVKLLHSFEYDEAEKVFSNIIDREPHCAMAYWGVAMSNFHPLWTPPSGAELQKGNKAIAIAQSITGKTKREEDYINAIAVFYKDSDKLDHAMRCNNFEEAMEQLWATYPDDKEAAVFYALALNAAASPSDKLYTKQKKAGAILNKLYQTQPNHPGIIHYIIHTYDAPGLAPAALEAARKYASVAPSSAHALHMPSHIFTRLGLWNECINSNLRSVASAQCYAESAGIKGHWDEELHGIDYLVYAYLQNGQNSLAKKQCDYLQNIREVHPLNFKVAYAFAAVPSRYLLENRLWKDAAELRLQPNVPWKNFPWQEAIIHFTKLLGAANTGKLDAARNELNIMHGLHDTLLKQNDAYKAKGVKIQLLASKAWILFKEGNEAEALNHMYAAADLEDNTEKHPVTPGEVLPARELLGDMLLQMNKSDKALEAYTANLRTRPNRFNGLYGAAVAAEKIKPEEAKKYYRQLLRITGDGTERTEIERAKRFLRS